MENNQVALLENILYISMIAEIDKIAKPYRIMEFDFSDNGIDVENFSEHQKIFVKEGIIKPTRKKIENYINESLGEEALFHNLHERLKSYSYSLEKKYFPKVEM